MRPFRAECTATRRGREKCGLFSIEYRTIDANYATKSVCVIVHCPCIVYYYVARVRDVTYDTFGFLPHIEPTLAIETNNGSLAGTLAMSRHFP